jgi:hypothetical protein
MSCVGYEPTIPASERAKILHALDRSATVTGAVFNKCNEIQKFRQQHFNNKKISSTGQ